MKILALRAFSPWLCGIPSVTEYRRVFRGASGAAVAGEAGFAHWRSLLLTLFIFAAIGSAALPHADPSVYGWGKFFVIRFVISPISFTLSVAGAWIASKGSKQTLWLLLLAPFAFWEVLLFFYVRLIWSITGFAP